MKKIAVFFIIMSVIAVYFLRKIKLESMTWVFLLFILFIIAFLIAVYMYAQWREKVRKEEGW